MNNEVYHSSISERSWRALLELQKRYEFVVIGGWGAWLYTHAVKSRDIEIIVGYQTLSQLRREYEIRKNERLERYEIECDGFDIEIYIPYYSTSLVIPPEIVCQHIRVIDGFRVPEPPILLALELGAWSERRNSLRGEKGKRDIQSLLPLVTREEFERTLKEIGLNKNRCALLNMRFNEAVEVLRNRCNSGPRVQPKL